MIIGIDASRAFLSKRTGIEEYSYQAIKHLREVLSPETEVRLYMRPGQGVDFTLPKNWHIRRLAAPRLWTQVRLSLEMLLYAPDILFVPAHTVPLIHPKRTIVTIHGLEYEFCPSGYSLLERLYMRWSIRFSCLASQWVISVSENTKKDLIQLYHVPSEKIQVIPEGFDEEALFREGTQDGVSEMLPKEKELSFQHPFLLFIGRLEERKNLMRIIEAYEIFKRETGFSHELVLAGKPGYGYEKIKNAIERSKYKEEIHEVGYVSSQVKWQLLKDAKTFVFPTLYEGFGIPVLEAQAAGLPLIVSRIASFPEVAGDGALYVDPLRTDQIAEALILLTQDEKQRKEIIEKGYQNVKHFSWEKMAASLARILK